MGRRRTPLKPAPAAPTDGVARDDYRFALVPICSSSKLHLGGDVVLVFDKLPLLDNGAVVTSPPFRILSRTPKKERRNAAKSLLPTSPTSSSSPSPTHTSPQAAISHTPQRAASPCSDVCLYSGTTPRGLFVRVRIMRISMPATVTRFMSDSAINFAHAITSPKANGACSVFRYGAIATTPDCCCYVFVGAYHTQELVEGANKGYATFVGGGNPIHVDLLASGLVANLCIFDNF
eukprot:TRINITY_DN4206_c0_g1_i2.p1 TRINITY_DN4206_c0_g1~~TRINITY_DN4206_c0_g1_i2.p1  ORF type:complete len:234 (+),score=53.81 TRINITY_DN4206_c0_g1_i2:523-1224(+)